jgi:hypothetical protein
VTIDISQLPPAATAYTARIVDRAAQTHGVPIEIARALVTQESGWRPYVTSRPNRNGTFDYGLFQLNSATFPAARGWTIERQADEALKFLASNYKQSGSWFDALRGYNAGPGRVKTNPDLAREYAEGVFKTAQTYGYDVTTDTPADDPNPIVRAIDRGMAQAVEALNPFDDIARFGQSQGPVIVVGLVAVAIGFFALRSAFVRA